MKRFLKIAVVSVLLCAILSVVAWWIYLEMTCRITAGPMVQMVTPSGFTVVWRTNWAGQGRLLVTDGTRQVADIRAAYEDGQHVAAVTGLQSGRPYHYQITHTHDLVEMSLGGPWTCKTDAGPKASFRLMAFGDSGKANRSQYLLSEQMVRYPVDLIIHTGDLIYPDGLPGCYPSAFFEPYAKLIASVAFMPVIGNHDYRANRGEPLLRTFVLPRNGPVGTDPERHYGFDYGCARFVAVDTDVDRAELNDRVAPWLKNAFASAGPVWRFVYFHFPPYTGSVKHPPDVKVQQTLVPVMEQARVDIVFAGHNHLYERSRPLRGGQIVGDRDGIVYIVTGAGGANRYAIKPPESRPPYTEAFYDEDFSFTLVEVAPTSLRLEQIDLRGRTVDRWELNRGPRASLTPSATHPTTATTTRSASATR